MSDTQALTQTNDRRSPSADGPWLDEHERRSNLTRSQYLIWTGQRLAPERPLYNMIYAFHLRGRLDAAAFAAAWSEAVAENEALRTIVEETDGVPQRRVLGRAAGELEQIDLTAAGQDDGIDRWLAARKVRPFELERSLVDTALIRLGDDEHVWYLNQHHLIADAASCSWIVTCVARHYGRLTGDDSAPQAGSSAGSFEAYAAEERAGRQTNRAAERREWWRDRLDPAPAATAFYQLPQTTGDGSNRRVSLQLSPARMDRLRELARSPRYRAITQDLSVANVLATAVLAFMARLSRPGRLALGLPLHNRRSRSDRATAGLFMEVYPLVLDVDAEAPLSRLGSDVQRGVLELFAHAGPGLSDASTSRACDVLLNFVPLKLPGFPGLSCTTSWVRSGYGDQQHRLYVLAYDFDGTGGLRIDLEFANAALPPGYASLALSQFERLLEHLLDGADPALRDLDLRTEAEREREEAFARVSSTPTAATVVDRFLAAADRHGSESALVCGGEAFDYQTVAARSARVAAALLAAGVRPGQLVPVRMARGPAAVIAILGVLRAGAAFVPLDTRHPSARVAAILEDLRDSGVGAAVLLADRQDEPVAGHEVLAVPGMLEAGQDDPALPPTAGGDLAYAIYTSGSTGRPKGVLVDHEALAAYIDWAASAYEPGPGESFALHTSLAVDLTLTSIFLPLTTGACVRIYPERNDGAPSVLDVYREDAVEHLKLTPSHLVLLGDLADRPARLRTLILGGEDLKTGLLRALADRLPPAVRIFNEYGPTEATVGCMIHRYSQADDALQSVPIGRPVDHARIRLLDPALRPVPTGTVGEICIGGGALARGYLGRRELTDARFVADPTRDGERLYLSGDLGRWTPDGRLEFLGRADTQLKRRGVRIEAGDVEAALESHALVAAAAVILRRGEAGQELLVACCQVPADTDPEALRSHLAERIPPEMMPDRFEAVAALPLGRSGKVDRAALAAGPVGDDGAAPAHPPSGPTEEALAELWCELLGVTGPGRDQNFFDLGGASLQAIQLGARVRQRFGIRLPLEALFATPTIAALAEQIETLILADIEGLSEDEARALAGPSG